LDVALYSSQKNFFLFLFHSCWLALSLSLCFFFLPAPFWMFTRHYANENEPPYSEKFPFGSLIYCPFGSSSFSILFYW
jgi:hypothetical protein